nr:MAG TPA: hypothetical protein [Caudoviricetes sp.]
MSKKKGWNQLRFHPIFVLNFLYPPFNSIYLICAARH